MIKDSWSSAFDLTLLCLAGVVLAACASPGAGSPEPPTAPEKPHTTKIHGLELLDEYFWLRERENPEVIRHLEAENAFTQAAMDHTSELRAGLFKEMKGRIKETDLSVPYRLGGYYYYFRTEEGKQYPIECRKEGSLEGDEQVILDVNQLAEGLDYFSLGVMTVSPNGKLLAFSTNSDGSENYTLQIKDLESGEVLSDKIPGTYYSVEWANDNKTIFYSTIDESHRPYKLFRHTIGQEAADDRLIYHEEDDKFFLSLTKTRSRAYLLLSLGSNNTSEVRVIEAGKPDSEFRIIMPRKTGTEYSLDHHGDHFYITTNDQAVNFRLMKAPVRNAARQNWKEVIPHRDDVLLQGTALFRNHMAIFERADGLLQVRVRDMKSGKTAAVEWDEAAYAVHAANNPEFDSDTLRLSYASMVTPRSIFDYDMTAGTRELLKQTEVLGGYEPGDYTTERIEATASDGAKIPISLVYKKGTARDGSAPLFMSGPMDSYKSESGT